MVWGSTFAKRFALCKSYPLLLLFDGFGLFSRNRASLFPTQLVHQCSSYSRASVFPISVPHTVVRHCSSSVFLIQSCVIVPCQCSSYNRASVFPTQPVLQCPSYNRASGLLNMRVPGSCQLGAVTSLAVEQTVRFARTVT